MGTAPCSGLDAWAQSVASGPATAASSAMRRACPGAAASGFEILAGARTRPEFEYAAIDDFSREGLANARERSTVAATRFLEYVLAQLPYRVEAVMTDNDMMFTMRYAFNSATPDAIRTRVEERGD